MQSFPPYSTDHVYIQDFLLVFEGKELSFPSTGVSRSYCCAESAADAAQSCRAAPIKRHVGSGVPPLRHMHTLTGHSLLTKETGNIRLFVGTFSRGQAVWFHLSNVELLRPVLVHNLHGETYRWPQ